MRKLMKKSIIFLSIFLFMFGWVIRSNVHASTPVELYDNVWRLINSKYVDQTNNEQDWRKWRHKYDSVIKTDEDAYVAIETMVASLNDPYTKFLDPKEFSEETNSIKGSLKGIGIQIGVQEGKLTVIAPIEDTPAEKAGLLAGDEILSIDGKSTKGITVDKAAEQIRGEEGTAVTLVVKRKDQEPKSYTITRAEIEIKSISQKVPENVTMPKDIVYIRLSSFISRNASKEFSVQSIVDYYNLNNQDGIYRKMVYRYLEKLEQACLISRVKRYDIATKRTLKQVEKQFVVDNGFLLACNDSNKIFVAHALENLIYNELLYRGYDVKIGKTYKGEIDFVAMKDGKKCFIQVAYLLSSDDVIEREFGAFDSVRDPSPKYVFSLDEYDMSKDGITHFNIEDWLLNKVDVTLS